MTDEEMMAAWMPEARDAAEHKATLLIGRVIMADCAIDRAFQGQRTFFNQKKLLIALRNGPLLQEEEESPAKAENKQVRTLWLRDVRWLSIEQNIIKIAENAVSYAEKLSKLRNTIAHGLIAIEAPTRIIHEHFLWCSNQKNK